MKESLRHKLDRLVERHQELEALLSNAEIISDQQRFRALSREYSRLEEVVACHRAYSETLSALSDAQALLQDADPELREMGQEEQQQAHEKLHRLQQQLQTLMLPRDPRDDCNSYLEIRAGTGGDEAALFAGDLFRMYSRYGERRGWRIEVISSSEGEHGGFREIICRVSGEGVYSRLKFESGAHRVQRVPVTESQGRIHTSACTVAILAEAEELEDITIRNEDLRVDTFRSSGAGGQHVNTTDSAVRMTHLPSGLVVECQDERSQIKNRVKAMALLKARLLDQQQLQQQQEQAATRKSLVGSGDRSERIRTYNFPQGRVTDHRINLTLYRLPEIMVGDLDELLDALAAEHQAELLASLSEEAS